MWSLRLAPPHCTIPLRTSPTSYTSLDEKLRALADNCFKDRGTSSGCGIDHGHSRRRRKELAAFTSTLLRKNNATIWWPCAIDLCVLAQEGERRRRRYMVAPRLRSWRLGRLVAVSAQRFHATQRRVVAGSGWRCWLAGWGPLWDSNKNRFAKHFSAT
jgi:hypothetical protein